MLNTGIIEIDVHGLTKYQAKICIDSQLKKANSSTYRIRVIHGFHTGTELKNMVKEEYGKKHPKVIRIEYGANQGATDLILRELY
jgi:DNA-nicking Smr family endonuclease